MNLAVQIRSLETAATELSKAATIRDKVKQAERVYAILTEFEIRVEEFVRTEIGSTNGHGRKKVSQLPKTERKKKTRGGRFKDMSLANVAAVLLRNVESMHGSIIEKRAKAGGFESDAKQFQSYLAVALKRDGRFVNIGENNWRMKTQEEMQKT